MTLHCTNFGFWNDSVRSEVSQCEESSEASSKVNNPAICTAMSALIASAAQTAPTSV